MVTINFLYFCLGLLIEIKLSNNVITQLLKLKHSLNLVLH